MRPSVVVEGARVFLGDCRDVLKTLPDNSVDSIVTDPPYELGFMGKSWDNSGIAYDVTVWEECLRVLKPGGHILAFGGTRTWHRLAVAIEDAGFELRDSIAWIYGSGFPKSLDVSKAIDRMKHDRQEIEEVVRWMESTRQRSGVTRRQVEERFGTVNIGQALFTITPGSAPRVPTLEQVDVLLDLFGLKIEDVPHDIHRLLIDKNAAKGQPGPNWLKREVVGKYKTDMGGLGGERLGSAGGDITAPATPEAEQWQGWGTALKPAFEPVVVGRKPLVGTVAENVLLWGVGGLNIDGSRIRTDEDTARMQPEFGVSNGVYGFGAGEGRNGQMSQSQGRWPANVVLDEFTAGLLDEQSGVLKSGERTPRIQETDGPARFNYSASTVNSFAADTGGASRFFYQAKASKRDRNEGLETPSTHPTVKPTQLMRYLIKLVTPEGGTVLDPFTGSGSTGKAALLDGYQFIGAELTEEYLPIIEGRLRWAVKNRDEETLF